MRTNKFQDNLRRTLEYNGFKVNQAMNNTDVGQFVSDVDDDDEEDEDTTDDGRTRRVIKNNT